MNGVYVPGDEQVDAGVVKDLEHVLDPRLRKAVVQGRRGELEQQRDPVDDGRGQRSTRLPDSTANTISSVSATTLRPTPTPWMTLLAISSPSG